MDFRLCVAMVGCHEDIAKLGKMRLLFTGVVITLLYIRN